MSANGPAAAAVQLEVAQPATGAPRVEAAPAPGAPPRPANHQATGRRALARGTGRRALARGTGGFTRPTRRGGFTLLEVIVALGVLAVGATAAFALLVAGAASGRRAEHEVNAALLAETVIDDLRHDVTIDLDLSDYPRASAIDPADPNPPPQGANPETRLLVRNETWTTFTDYKYDLALTPLPDPTAPPDGPWRFLAEVEVRWSDQGQRRSAFYATVLVKGVTGRQLPQPAANPRVRPGP